MALSLGLCISAYAQLRITQSVLTHDGIPKFVKFDTETNDAAFNRADDVLTQVLGLTADDELRVDRVTTDQLGYTHERRQQYFKGVPVEYGTFTVHAVKGQIRVANGEYKRIDPEMGIAPAIGEDAALQRALNHVGASQYMWENAAMEAWLQDIEGDKDATHFPEGELVIVQNYLAERGSAEFLEPRLAYKFNIYAEQPLSRDFVYVDAINGEVIHTNAIIKHAAATGTADTRYSGTQTISTDSYSGAYRLRDYTRGSGIITLDLNNGTNYNSAVDFVDNDNNWTAAEWDNANEDNAALDAHWGAIETYDYWTDVHSRNSYNGSGAAIRSYVHYSSNYDNAFWNGSVMTYGDGNTFEPLTSLDVAAHEIGHAVCTSTANLVYSYESGALNESFSDIWAACVENYANVGKQIWLVGEDIGPGGNPLRSMSNPNDQGDPDTYQGTYWNFGSSDNGGVHTNSGVFNHWFYLLSVGGSGTNDNGDSFTVSGIGIDKAELIAFRLEDVYLSANSDYADARTYGIQSAVDLYGAGSAEEIAVTNAFYAVGVGAAYGGGGGGGNCYDGATAVTSFPYSESFETSAGAWEQASCDDIDWTRDSGGTPSSSTGPSSGSAGSYYMYVEASSPNYPSKTSDLYADFDLSGVASPEIDFDYHSYGTATDVSLKLEASTDGTTWSTLWSITGNQGNQWNAVNVDLSAYSGSTVTLRFAATTGSTWQGDVAIDNVRVAAGSGGGGGGDCTAASPTGYCSASGGNVNYEWIDVVQFAGINNSTGANGGYGNFTSQVANVVPGNSYTATFSAGFSGSTYAENWKIYIDLNRDGDFGDAGEEVVTGSTSNASNYSATVTIPAGASEGNTRMRVVMWWNTTAASCGSATYGEVEDYTVNICSGGSVAAANQGITIGSALEREVVTSRLALYPNPADESLSVSVMRMPAGADLVITDLAGKTLQVQSAREAGATLDISQLQEGMYLLQVRGATEVLTERFYKQ